jgi:holo-[acyl-carrier protein] synthase
VILGLGNDLIDIRRVEASIERFGERFLNRVFCPEEREFCELHAKPAGRYAKRFAAKEACSKALGTGINKGVAWRDICVISQPSGMPAVRLTGGALRRLLEITPNGHKSVIHLTMTDDYPWAQAVVIVSAESDTPAG